MSYSTNNIGIERVSFTSNMESVNGKINKFTMRPYANLFYPFVQDFGGNTYKQNLTIKTFDKTRYKQNLSNSHIIKNKNRDLIDFANPFKYWGFEETKNQISESESCCNCWCFAGQKVSFKIDQKGHMVGFLGNQMLYSKTRIDIIATDVAGKTIATIKSFDNFEIDNDDPSRYFVFQIPNSINIQEILDNNQFGRIIFELRITYSLYEKSDWTIPYENMESIQNSSFIQMNVFSAAIEARHVDTNIQLFTSLPTYTDSFEQLFSKSIFSEFEDNSNISLSEDQKRAIITDQIAVLFMSQHAIASSDYFPVKILGFGGESSEEAKFIDNNIKSKSNLNPVLEENRLFGLKCNFKTFAFQNELDELVESNTLSIQKIKDPVRILCFDTNGKMNNFFGENGVILDPFSCDIINAEIATEGEQETEFTMSFRNNSIEIGNIIISNLNGGIIQESTKEIKVKFTYFYGMEIANRMRVSLIANNNKILLEKIYDSDVENINSVDFVLPTNIANIIKSSGVTNTGDILTIKIEIEDIYEFVNTFYKDLYVPGDFKSCGITGFYGIQSKKGSNSIEFFYNYFGASEINSSNIDILYSLDKNTWNSISLNSYGDIGTNVMPGYNNAVWIVPNSIKNSYPDKIYAKITLSDIDSNKNTIKDKIIAVSCDFRQPHVTLRESPNV